MLSDKLSRRPPATGEFNERILITEQVIEPAQYADEQYLKNIQAKWYSAAIYNQQPISPKNYENNTPSNENDTGIWVRIDNDYLPQINHNIYRPYRRYGQKIDYIYKINKIGQEFISKGLYYFVCRTDIIKDVKLVRLDKPTKLYIPFS
jgi:hypothetical protein